MNIKAILRSEGVASAITICLLLSSYIFTLAYNASAARFGEISSTARIFMFLTIFFLFLFLAGFVIFLILIFQIADAKEIFMNPGKASIISIVMLLCSYLSTVMHSYVAPALGEISSVTQIFFYLALSFIIFFVITFIAMLVSLSNKFIYSRKL